MQNKVQDFLKGQFKELRQCSTLFFKKDSVKNFRNFSVVNILYVTIGIGFDGHI